MTRYLSYFGRSLLLIFSLLAALLVALGYTTTGARIALKTASLFLPGTLQVDTLQGRLLGPLSIQTLTYTQDTLRIQAEQLNVKWHLQFFNSPDFLIENMHMKRLTLHTDDQLTMQLNEIYLSGNKAHYHGTAKWAHPARGTLSGSLKHLTQLDITSRWHDAVGLLAQLNLQGNLPAPWNATLTVPQVQRLTPELAEIKTALRLNATVHAPDKATLHLTLPSGTYTPSNSPAIPFQGGQFTLSLASNTLKGDGQITFEPQNTVHLALRLPNFELDHLTTPNAPLKGHVKLTLPSLAFLNGIIPDIERIQGKLAMHLNLQGTWSTPAASGELSLAEASLVIPTLNLPLTAIEATLTHQNNQWIANGLMRSNQKTLVLQGNGSTSPAISGKLTLKGEQFPLMNTAEYQIMVSPNLTLRAQSNVFMLSGQLLVPTARISPMLFGNTVNLTDDVVFEPPKQQSSPILNVTTDVLISMGKDVTLDLQGLKGFLDGELRLRQTPGGALNGTGALRIRDGKYRAYGQELLIEQGELLFSGGVVTNPGLRLSAVRRFKKAGLTQSSSNQLLDFNNSNLKVMNFENDLSVGIRLSGRAHSPEISLFSNPATLSQADILSMLVLGRPASQASQSGTQLLLNALSAMNLDTGAKGANLMNQLRENLGFDFDLQQTSTYNQQTGKVSDRTAFVVSKSLSNRLYLSYTIGLLQQDSNLFTLKYLLNQFFNIQVTTSDVGNGIDFFYTRSHD